MSKSNNKKTPGSPKSQGLSYLKEGTKYSNIIDVFQSGKSLNRFEAERYGDHCLNTTVSTISIQLDLEIPRKMEQVPNRFGGTTNVMRYWFSESDIQKIKLLKEKQL
ncbi:MAG: hypothetical protein K0U08_03775 [Proteobacteria bacterium]|nr:hypothetical protein [Pseudomonadota bacterium]MCH9712181.1 hypothetical protein [Pseudomonadota bacterium]MCH9750454.1 hypothetical protein [Pseudomonadota bacterium]